MENTNVATSGVSVDRILGLQAEISAKDLVINSLHKEVGTLENQTSNLESQIFELKGKLNEKTPEVRVVNVTKKVNSWGDTYNDTVVEYKNLSSVQDDIRKEIEAKFKKEIDKATETIKTLNSQLENAKESYDKEVKQIKSTYKTYELELRLENDEKERNRKERLEKKDLEIKKLNDEIEKIKNDKTDEQVAKQREEEIIKLKLRIKELEKAVKNFMDMNLFKRFWNSITNKAVRVAAEKEVIEKQNEVDRIKSNVSTRGYYNPFFGWIA